MEIAVEELLKTLPERVNLDSSSITPFEIIRASFSPEILRGGETARLTLEVKEITGKVRDIKAFILDTEVELNTEDGRWYFGAITAPSVEGVYPLKMYLTDRWNRLFSVDDMATLTVHNSPPKITLSLRQRLISPNNDSINDYALLIPEVLKSISLERWKVEITNEDDQIVRSEEGVGGLPEGFVWRGMDDRFEIVNDGIYFFQLVAEDKAGNTTSTSKERIVVDAITPAKTKRKVKVGIAARIVVCQGKDLSNVGSGFIGVSSRQVRVSGRMSIHMRTATPLINALTHKPSLNPKASVKRPPRNADKPIPRKNHI